jgi:putative FmdB family regulatory protein
MPIYEYRCHNCGIFDKMQKASENPLTSCPVCQDPVERIIGHNVGIQFKGAGFYSTDSSMLKDRVRSLNKERQKDNECILDGDVKRYADQSESTTKKVLEA